MFLLGVMITLVGAAARNIGLAPYEIGLLMGAQNLGFLISVVLAGTLADILPKTRILLVASLILCGSLFIFYATEILLLNMAAMFFVGIGIGAFEGVTDALLLDLHPQRPSLFMNVNHFFVTAGGLGITAYLIFLQMSWRRSITQAGFVVLILAIIFLILKSDDRSSVGRKPVGSFRERVDLLRESRVFLWLFLATVCMLGFSVGNTSILTTYLMEIRDFDQVTSKIGLIVYLSGVGIGRLMVGFFTKSERLYDIIIFFFTLSAVSLSLLYFAPLGVFIYPILVASGVAFSALMPSMFALVGQLFGRIAGTAMGLVKIGIPIGGIAFPFLFSLIARYGSFELSLYLFPVFTIGGLLIMSLCRRRLKRLVG
jgi:predicted MFS family arabinose efflux permease